MIDRAPARLVAIGAVAVAACAQRDVHGSPQAVVEAFADANIHRDVEGMRATVVPVERMRRAIACPADGKIHAIGAIENARETLGERAGMITELIAVTELAHRTVARGERWRDCAAAEAFEDRTIQIEVVTHDPGHPHEIESGDVVRLDGAWWLVVP